MQMKKLVTSKAGIDIDDFPDNLVKLVNELIDDKNFPDKHNARIALVKLGKPIIPYMHRLLSSEDSVIRMEAAKVVELIADKRSIHLLIGLLEDEETGIRWIAAEGLVNIGRPSILPLLRSIRDGKNPVFLYRGAHHVLNGLLNEEEKKNQETLLLSLDNYHQLGGTSPALASKALKTIIKRNT
jgi:HEAT repeat protein